MGKLIIDYAEGDEPQPIDYATLDPDLVTALAIGGDDDAMAQLLKDFEATNPDPLNGDKEMKSLGKFTTRDWAEWDLEHPYISKGDREGSSTEAVASTHGLADAFAESHNLTPGSQDAVDRASIVWAATYVGCTNVQNAADSLVGVNNDWVSALEYPGDAGEKAFSARELLNTISDPSYPGHKETDDQLFRGIKDEDGSIAAKFVEGQDVSFGLAAFTNEISVAGSYAASDKPGGGELLVKTTGTVAGADIAGSLARDGYGNSTETVSGGTWHVESVDRSDDPLTVVTISQKSLPKVKDQ